MNLEKWLIRISKEFCFGIAVAGTILFFVYFDNLKNFDWHANLGVSGLLFMSFGCMFWFMIQGSKEYKKQVKSNALN